MVPNKILCMGYWTSFKMKCFGRNLKGFQFLFDFYCLEIFPVLVNNPSWLYLEFVMALPGVRNGSAWSLSWLCKKSVMALKDVPQGGVLPVAAEASLHRWWIPPEPWRIAHRAMTDSFKSHDGLLIEPWKTLCRAMTELSQRRGSYFQTWKTKKIYEN